jgi:hypothetical protein
MVNDASRLRFLAVQQNSDGPRAEQDKIGLPAAAGVRSRRRNIFRFRSIAMTAI